MYEESSCGILWEKSTVSTHLITMEVKYESDGNSSLERNVRISCDADMKKKHIKGGESYNN